MALKAHHLAWIISAGFVLLAVAYARVTPVFEAPDEGSHFLYIHNLIETRKLPVLEARDTMFASQSVQRHHPPLYYVIGAGLVAWADRSDTGAYLQPNPLASIGSVTVNNQNVLLHPLHGGPGGTENAVWVLRLYSIALAVGTLWCIYGAVTLAYGRRSAGLLAMALVAVMPSFVFISASVNNDNLVTLCFAAGVWWTLYTWRRERVTGRSALLLGVILSGAALSKISGLALLGVVFPALLVAAWTGRLSWREVALAAGVAVVMLLALAGWWYLRNWRLYDDPLALDATMRIWGRGDVEWTWHRITDEAKGTWESLWMVLGYFNVRGPGWLYPYVTAISVVGMLGAVWSAWRTPRERLPSLFLALVCVLVVAALVMATRRINVSQGRILFPGLVGFAGLLVNGWLALGGRKLAGALLLPLAVVAISAPVTVMRPAWTPLETVTALPDSARRVDAQAESLQLLAYAVEHDVVAPGEVVALDLYFTGYHPANPGLYIKALDPLTLEPLGGVDTYPGMAPTASLIPSDVYRARVRFRLGQDASGPPRALLLAFGWRTFDAQDASQGTFIPWADANGTPLESLLVPGPVLVDAAYDAPPPAVRTDIVFGDAIRLRGYTLADSQAAPGDTVQVTLLWEAIAPLAQDWTLTAALEGIAGAQADGPVPGYPTSRWQPGTVFPDTRAITVPADAAPGTVALYVGWYRRSDGVRLPALAGGVRDNLYFLPTSIEILGGD